MRGLPANIRPNDELWCVVGLYPKGGGGVLEWCYNRADANQMLQELRNSKRGYKNLRARKWDTSEQNWSHPSWTKHGGCDFGRYWKHVHDQAWAIIRRRDPEETWFDVMFDNICMDHVEGMYEANFTVGAAIEQALSDTSEQCFHNATMRSSHDFS